MKGIVFSMDAAAAIAILMIVAATAVTLMENNSQSDRELYLYRLARDVYEVRLSNPSASLPSWLLTDCASASQIGSENAIQYDTAGKVKVVTTKVCISGT